MKRQLLVLIILMSLYFPLRADFVEKFRTVPNRRIPLNFIETLKNSLKSVNDINGNGAADRAMLVPDGKGGVNLHVFDSIAKTSLWRYPLTSELDVLKLDYLGFFDFKGDGTPYNVLCTNENLSEFWIINTQTNGVEYNRKNTRLLGVIDINRDGLPEICLGDTGTHEVVVLGWSQGNFKNVSGTTNQSVTQQFLALEYSVTLKYQSARGARLLFNDNWFQSLNSLDFEGDGTTDLVLIIENQANQSVGLVVLDGVNYSIKWQFNYPQAYLEDLAREFHGFYDTDGNGEKEAIFGHHTVVLLDGSVHSLNPSFEIKVVYDVDNDGYSELIGFNGADSTVQAWGVKTSSGVTEAHFAAAGFQLLQNYPNPFNPTTAINYSVSNSARVRLSIFNTAGQLVRTLVDDSQPAGFYTVVWDGRDELGQSVSTGMYLYRLQAGDQVLNRKLMMMK